MDASGLRDTYNLRDFSRIEHHVTLPIHIVGFTNGKNTSHHSRRMTSSRIIGISNDIVLKRRHFPCSRLLVQLLSFAAGSFSHYDRASTANPNASAAYRSEVFWPSGERSLPFPAFLSRFIPVILLNLFSWPRKAAGLFHPTRQAFAGMDTATPTTSV